MDWEGNACVFWNAGQAALDGLSRVWKGMFLNACTGALETPDMYIVSGSALVNLGQILVQPVSPELGGEGLYLQTGASLYNNGSKMCIRDSNNSAAAIWLRIPERS